ncbi:hypothetical protein BpHYR1_026792 [Brachionus plicatilis]|uniref:Uncharacterized protein n=1 Tax=Brachionus plicatilis TaxID=10195 RepID=A0A3M7QPR5_BRAPC|nr:hypothetical protein BpHYR1_026792 [Brachionus plicatilis]
MKKKRPINNRDDDADNDAEIEERPNKKIRKANRSYVHHDDFQTYKEAIDLVLENFEDNSWAAKEKKVTSGKGKIGEIDEGLYARVKHTKGTFQSYPHMEIITIKESDFLANGTFKS